MYSKHSQLSFNSFVCNEELLFESKVNKQNSFLGKKRGYSQNEISISDFESVSYRKCSRSTPNELTVEALKVNLVEQQPESNNTIISEMQNDNGDDPREPLNPSLKKKNPQKKKKVPKDITNFEHVKKAKLCHNSHMIRICHFIPRLKEISQRKENQRNEFLKNVHKIHDKAESALKDFTIQKHNIHMLNEYATNTYLSYIIKILVKAIKENKIKNREKMNDAKKALNGFLTYFEILNSTQVPIGTLIQTYKIDEDYIKKEEIKLKTHKKSQLYPLYKEPFLKVIRMKKSGNSHSILKDSDLKLTMLSNEDKQFLKKMLEDIHGESNAKIDKIYKEITKSYNINFNYNDYSNSIPTAIPTPTASKFQIISDPKFKSTIEEVPTEVTGRLTVNEDDPNSGNEAGNRDLEQIENYNPYDYDPYDFLINGNLKNEIPSDEAYFNHINPFNNFLNFYN